MTGTAIASRTPLLVGEDDVARHLTVPVALASVRRGFELLARGEIENPPRMRQVVGSALANTMWAAAESLGTLGVKLYPIVRRDVTQGSAFTFVLYALPAAEVRAIVSAELLGQRRTAAASALASTLLAPPEPRTLGIVGAGGQARHQAEALLDALPFEEVRVASRTAASRDALVDALRRDGRQATAVDAESAAAADVVVAITGSAEPVIRGEWLRAGTLVVAAGSNMADKRELDRDAVLRADRIVVDDRAAAQAECGDLLANGLGLDGVETLADVVAGRAPARRPDEVVLFESHGLAMEDLLCALHVVEAIEKEAA